MLARCTGSMMEGGSEIGKEMGGEERELGQRVWLRIQCGRNVGLVHETWR